ncbi:hypothetical protein K438DRAFT_914376 [Mycena galopus ATCC 62051]|nr:hypothetical protein K438DRAFT_914376 [Mycena galopus ATCC 62051]
MASPSGWASSPSSSGLILACFVTDSMFVSAADSHVAALADFYVATRRLFSNSFLSSGFCLPPRLYAPCLCTMSPFPSGIFCRAHGIILPVPSHGPFCIKRRRRRR